MSKLVYVHGTNGSGKSTLARALLAQAGGVDHVFRYPGYKKVTVTRTNAGVDFVGTYGSACGGVDGLNPYAGILDVVLDSTIQRRDIFAEGLVTPGLDTCLTMADLVGDAWFIYLQTPNEQAVKNVLARRARKGTDKPYNPDNLYKKTRSAESWANRLFNAGLRVVFAPWDLAYTVSANVLGLEHEDINHHIT